MSIEIVTENLEGTRHYYAALDLHAKEYEIRDAYQKVRMDRQEEMYADTEVLRCAVLPQLTMESLGAPTVEEFNFLAKRLAALSEREIFALRGIYQKRVSSGQPGATLQIKDLINMTYHLESVVVIPDVLDDEDLGQSVIENELNKNLDAAPGEAVYLLDQKKIGMWQRKVDEGVYVDGAYVATAGYKMPEVYDGVSLPEEQPEDYIFRIKVGNPRTGTEENAQWLCIPANSEDMMKAAVEQGKTCIEDCKCFGFESAIPQIRQEHFPDIREIEKLNTIALEIAQMSSEDQVKFKAVLEKENCQTLDEIWSALQKLDRYQMEREADDEDTFFKIYLKAHLDPKFDPEWLETLLCQQEGCELLYRLDAAMTEYGVISAVDHPLFELVTNKEPWLIEELKEIDEYMAQSEEGGMECQTM